MLQSELEELIERAAREEWEELDLSGKGIEELPATIAKCQSLKKLILGKITERKYYNTYIGWTTEYKFFSNRLKNLPPELAELTNLQSLDLSSNSLSAIPDSITRLTKLSYLDLDENPITEPPLEVVKEGIAAIRQYFKQIETEGIDYLYEAKLLIVGEGGAGKTSLANKIINPKYQLCEEDSTKGIEAPIQG